MIEQKGAPTIGDQFLSSDLMIHDFVDKNKISVIVPVYNVEKYISRCLDSIITNDYPDLEILCINDGSTDKGLDVLLEYARKDNRIVVIDTKHGGVSKARNIGLDMCSGEYVAFIDADDCIHSQYFNVLYRTINSRSADVVLCKWERFSEEYKSSPIDILQLESKQCAMVELLNTELSLNCWARLYRKSIISCIRFSVNLEVYEDGVFNNEVMWNNREKNAVIIDYPLYYYFIRTNSATHTHNFLPARSSTIKCYIQKAEFYDDSIDKEYWVRSAIESAFVYRYYAYSQSEKEHIKQANLYIKASLRIIMRYSLFSLKTRTRFMVFSAFPGVYKRINKLD